MLLNIYGETFTLLSARRGPDPSTCDDCEGVRRGGLLDFPNRFDERGFCAVSGLACDDEIAVQD